MAGSSATYQYYYATGPGVTFTLLNSNGVTITDSSDGIYTAGSGESITLSGALSGTATIQSFDESSYELIVKQGSNYYFLSNNGGYTSLDTYNGITSGADYLYCFLAGTGISTATGTKPVEQLKVGDEVTTMHGGTAKVRFNFIQHQRNHFFINKENTYPFCIQAHALADNVPSRDLYVTADHAIYFPEWNFFVEASILAVIVNDTSIYQMRDMPETFTYYHILCDNQEIVLAENTPAETFIDNVSMETFDNYAEYAAMYPQEHDMEELDIPRARSMRPLPRAFKQNLLDRAQQLYPVAQAA